MKILFCTARLPRPSMKGDQVIAFQRLQYLAQRHQIVLLSFYENDQELEHLKPLEEICQAVHLVKLNKAESALGILSGALDPALPFQVGFYKSQRFGRALSALLQQNQFDLVHGFLIRLAPYFSAIKIPVVLEAIDSMVLNFERRLQQEHGLKRWIVAEELRRLKHFESRAVEKSAAALVVSAVDKNKIADSKVFVVPVGVDTDSFLPSNRPTPQQAIFSGNMSYEPNVTAVKWFVQHCFSEIKARIPNFQLVIAGSSPLAAVQALSQKPGIQVTGRVPSMVEVLQQSQIALAPMQSGSGQQIKILEAMACGLPVVATTLGLGDIKATPGSEVLLADQPQDYVSAVLRLLNNPELGRSIGSKARCFVLENHSWDKLNQQVDLLYSTISAHPMSS